MGLLWRAILLKFPVQVPLRTLHHPKNPKPPPLFILHDKIIARLVMPLPPLPANAFGPNRMHQPMHLPAKSERNRPPIAIMRRRNHRANFQWHFIKPNGTNWWGGHSCPPWGGMRRCTHMPVLLV